MRDPDGFLFDILNMYGNLSPNSAEKNTDQKYYDWEEVEESFPG
jgi:hypothetical protein